MEWEEYPIYMFTSPTFDSREECIASVLNPDDVPGYVTEIILEYGRPMPIKGINCIDENLAKQLQYGDAI
jgi:hypothetical protein